VKIFFWKSNFQGFQLIFLDYSVRGDKKINLKGVVDDALKECKDGGLEIKMCIVVKNESVESSGTSSPKQKKSNIMV